MDVLRCRSPEMVEKEILLRSGPSFIGPGFDPARSVPYPMPSDRFEHHSECYYNPCPNVTTVCRKAYA
jgi:hypothetical protein